MFISPVDPTLHATPAGGELTEDSQGCQSGLPPPLPLPCPVSCMVMRGEGCKWNDLSSGKWHLGRRQCRLQTAGSKRTLADSRENFPPPRPQTWSGFTKDADAKAKQP